MRNLSIILGGLFFFFSCSDKMIHEEEAIGQMKTKSEMKEGYEVIDGTLHFKSIEDFSRLIDSLGRLDTETLYLWEKENGFYSLAHAIDDADNQVFTEDDEIVQRQLDAYSDIVYLNENGMLSPYIVARIYQIACNRNCEFYIGGIKYEVSGTHVTITQPTKSVCESIPYMVNEVSTKGNVDITIPLGAAGYNTDTRLVNVYMHLYRTVFVDKQGKKVGQVTLEWKSEAGKRRKANKRFRAYKTQHKFEGLAYRINKVGKKVGNNHYELGTVENLLGGGGGTVGGDEKVCTVWAKFPLNDYIPIEYLPMDKANVVFAEVRATTRGTGDCGARLLIGDKWKMPFWLNECGPWRREVGVFD